MAASMYDSKPRVMPNALQSYYRFPLNRTASRTGINGKKKSLRRPKHSMTEVVEPEEVFL
jgi:hypothetical protein